LASVSRSSRRIAARSGEHVLAGAAGVQQRDLRTGRLDQQRLEGDHQRGPLGTGQFAIGQHLADTLDDQRRHRFVQQAFVGADDGRVDFAEPEEFIMARGLLRGKGAPPSRAADRAKASVESLGKAVSWGLIGLCRAPILAGKRNLGFCPLNHTPAHPARPVFSRCC
jgi:hypothetical protein